MALTERHPDYKRQPKIEKERAGNRSTGRNGSLTAPARRTKSKAKKTSHYYWYSVRVAQPLVRQAKLGVSYIVTCQTKVDGKSVSGKD